MTTVSPHKTLRSRRFELPDAFDTVLAFQPRPQDPLGVQNGGLEKALANSRSRDHNLANHKARCQFETIKISIIFVDT